MLTINVTSAEELIYKEFKDGNTVQFRVNVSKEEEKTYQKGKQIVVKFGNEESNGKIVSDPLVVTPAVGAEKETISLVVEKAN